MGFVSYLAARISFEVVDGFPSVPASLASSLRNCATQYLHQDEHLAAINA
eukprot:COSAG02_NODE_604_length_19688_cov_77.556231_10_plen_50_part_00